jgi:hypothetical protein
VQNIDMAELRHGGLHRGSCRIFLREIAAQRDCLRPGYPNLVSDPGRLRLVDIDDCNGGAFAGQFVRRRRTNPARTSRNYRDLSGKSGHRVLPKYRVKEYRVGSFSVTHKKDNLI